MTTTEQEGELRDVARAEIPTLVEQLASAAGAHARAAKGAWPGRGR
ncbi:MAG: hypothetical protein M3433_01095 [Actinomycetota bacterium]|nr:hypothetical protein [Actinomycetota bacterium]